MARRPRSSVISSDEITIAHVWSQTVQQMFLLGRDELTNRDYSHRKDWVIDIMAHQSMFMAVDILRFAIMDNHVHFLLRTRPDIVRGWSDEEVAWNYLLLCPKKKRRKKVDGKWEYEVVEPSQCDIDAIVNDAKKLKKLRQKLSSLSFWMQLLKQKVAKKANAEVQKEGVCKGAFWKGRFEMTVILTQEHLLTCSAYIDLNPFRAKMTDRLDGYRYTSVYSDLMNIFRQMLERNDLNPTEGNPLGEFPESSMISPLYFVDNQPQAVVAAKNANKPLKRSRKRCSEEGFLEITLSQYHELLEWSMRQLRDHGNETLSGLTHALISSHGMTTETWADRLSNFRRLFRHQAGVSNRKLLEGFCGKPTAATFLALREMSPRSEVIEPSSNLS